MSLYNMSFGRNPNAQFYLRAAGLKDDEIPRFRDCYLENGLIVVYTRTGGGNRECFAEDGDCSRCYHTANDALASKSNYKGDEDDDYDRTYAYFRFEPLPKYRDLFGSLNDSSPLIGEKFRALIEELEKGSHDPA